MNSPKAGTIVELYAKEEDTVAVGADLFKLELGDAPAGGKKCTKMDFETSILDRLNILTSACGLGSFSRCLRVKEGGVQEGGP